MLLANCSSIGPIQHRICYGNRKSRSCEVTSEWVCIKTGGSADDDIVLAKRIN